MNFGDIFQPITGTYSPHYPVSGPKSKNEIGSLLGGTRPPLQYKVTTPLAQLRGGSQGICVAGRDVVLATVGARGDWSS